jgi:hypothetical protein
MEHAALDLIWGLCQLVFTLDSSFDTGLWPTQGASSGAHADVLHSLHQTLDNGQEFC